MMKASDAA